VASTLPEIAMIVESSCIYNERCFRDVLYGIPISESKLQSLDILRQRIHKLSRGVIHILIDHAKQLEFVEKFIENEMIASAGKDVVQPLSVFLKLDTGYHRAGISCDSRGVSLAIRIIKSPFVVLKGLYSHWYARNLSPHAEKLSLNQTPYV
jgi:D-serine deaminase-like pyridoxal phosphate-dependent protein